MRWFLPPFGVFGATIGKSNSDAVVSNKRTNDKGQIPHPFFSHENVFVDLHIMRDVDEDGESIGRDNFIKSMNSKYILQLDVKTLSKAIEDNPHLFVAFCVPWCSYCTKIGSELSKTAKKRHGDIVFGIVDVSSDVQIWDAYGIVEFPSFIFFNHGSPTAMQGEHHHAGFEHWLDQQLQPLFLAFENERGVLDFVQQHKSLKVAVFNGNWESQEFELFENLAQDARDHGFLNKFAIIHNETATYFSTATFNLNQFYVASFSVVVNMFCIFFMRSPVLTYFGDEATRTYQGYYEEEPLRAFMKRQQFASFAELNVHSMNSYHENPLDAIVIVCFPPTEVQRKVEDWRSFFIELATEFDEQFLFTWIDTAIHGDLAKQHLGCEGLHPEEGVTIAVMSNISNHGPTYLKTFTNHQHHPNWHAEVQPWLKEVVAGQIQKHVFSKSGNLVASKDNEFVQEVTAATWKKLVIDSGKDSIVLIYASWCPHSRYFSPIYTQFARIMAEHNVSGQLNILHLDGEKNTIDHEGLIWTRFPTLYYIRQGEDNPVFYDVTRAKGADLVALVQEQASFAELAGLKEAGTDPDINMTKMSETFNAWAQASKEVSGSVRIFVDDYRKLLREVRKNE